jgi:UDP-2-acetamido-2,6-beta-L-arabino-hexul-4-ose reductase
VLAIGRTTFDQRDELERIVAECDVIVHLAGQNRGPDDEVERTNVTLATSLARAMRRGGRAQVVFADSIQRDDDTPYGRSKAAAAVILGDSTHRHGGTFADVVLPNVFGEHGRPFSNSVVSTFCHQLATDASPRVMVDRELELLHGLAAAEVMIRCIDEGIGGEVRPAGAQMTVSVLLDQLSAFHSIYRDGSIPEMATTFDRDLFNTYRSFVLAVRPRIGLRPHTDQRGEFVELVRSNQRGQTSLSRTVTGVTRGNHFHLHKIERFVVLEGSARIEVRRLFTDDVMVFNVNGRSPEAIDMPTMHTHNITNTGSDDLITIFWSDDLFDPAAPDTYPEPVT